MSTSREIESVLILERADTISRKRTSSISNHLISIPCLSAVIETFKDQLSPKLRQLFNFIHAKDEDAFDHLMQWSEWTRMLIYVSAGQ